MQPCNHKNIPNYQNIDPSINNTFRVEKPSIDSINERLAKLSPKGIKIAESVGIIGIAVIPLIGLMVVNATTGILVGAAVIGCGIAAYERLRYYNYMLEVKNLEESIASWYNGYSKEFTFLEKKNKWLFETSEEVHNRIGRYIESHGNIIRVETHYRLEGGIIGFTSHKPMKLVQVCQKTNESEIAKKYKPWIDLLVELANRPNIPEGFMELVGMMAGFRRTPGIEKNIGDDYTGVYDDKNNKIKIKQVKDSTQNRDILTLEECRQFVEIAFKE